MEVFAMLTGAAITLLSICVIKLWRDVADLREKYGAHVAEIAEEVVDGKAQEYEANWQTGVSNIMGYDMTVARKAGRDE